MNRPFVIGLFILALLSVMSTSSMSQTTDLRKSRRNLMPVPSSVVWNDQRLPVTKNFKVAVQGQTGAQPEGAFLNLVNWIGNVIAPVGAGLALAAGLVAYMSGRGAMRYVMAALGCLAVSGITRLLEFWIQQGGGGVS